MHNIFVPQRICDEEGVALKLNVITLAAIALFVAIFARQASGFQWTPNRIIGTAIAAPALLLLILARLELGRAFRVRARATSLVTSGLYARIRNPIYVFGSFLILGAVIFTGRPWLLLILVVLIPLQIYRSLNEAKVLEEKFGTEYLAYKQKTWF
jgi:protein-S-isoprenylcysteine O-methyltransferase Ste14